LTINEAAPITGLADLTTGQRVLDSGTYNAHAVVAGFGAGDGVCDFTFTAAPSTETTAPYHGRRFNNPVGGASSPGSLAGSGTLTQVTAPSAPCVVLNTGGVTNGASVALWLGFNSIPT